MSISRQRCSSDGHFVDGRYDCDVFTRRDAGDAETRRIKHVSVQHGVNSLPLRFDPSEHNREMTWRKS